MHFVLSQNSSHEYENTVEDFSKQIWFQKFVGQEFACINIASKYSLGFDALGPFGIILWAFYFFIFWVVFWEK